MERYSHYVILWKDIDVNYVRVPALANPRLYTMKYNDWIEYITKMLFDIFSHFTFVKVYLFLNKSSTFHNCGRIHDIFPHFYFLKYIVQL